MQQQNSSMTQDRSLIGMKELSYLKDFLSWELLAVKKCNDTANQCQDQELAQWIRQTGRQHEAHYNQILSQLQS